MSKVMHFEISAREPESLIRFYESVLGWKGMKWEGPMEYWMLETGPDSAPGIGGGLARRGEEPAATVNTIGVASLDETLERFVAKGGAITQPKGPIPGVGWLAYVRDPEGNAFGLMQSDPSAK